MTIHLLAKIFQLTGVPIPAGDVMRRRERANAFCESIRALDATGFCSYSKSTLSSISLSCPADQNQIKLVKLCM